jgi:hypothetical protein
MTATNTWYYRFAFRAEEQNDIPLEFRHLYQSLVASKGHPAFGLFTPAIEDHAFLFSERIPPRLILVFQDSLVVISLDYRSDQVHTFEFPREDFLGFGFGEFLLKCWLALYRGGSTLGSFQLRFPSRAGEHFAAVSRLLLGWCNTSTRSTPPVPQASCEIAGLPAKFSSFLRAHPELAPTSEFFFQPALEAAKKRRSSFANLLLMIASKGIVVLGDRYKNGTSEFGIETTYLPLTRVRSAEWVASTNGSASTLRISLQGKSSHLDMSWPVFYGMGPYGVRWVSAVNETVELFHLRGFGIERPTCARPRQC